MSINTCEKCRQYADDGLTLDANGFYVCHECFAEEKQEPLIIGMEDLLKACEEAIAEAKRDRSG